MRLIHTSDWHLGQEFHNFDRGSEHDALLDWLLARVKQLKADALVVTGDVYDSGNPPVAAQQRLYRFLSRLLSENASLQVVVIGGNHDSPSRLELPRSLLTEQRVHLVGSVPRTDGQSDVRGTVLTLRDRRGRPTLSCVAMPFVRSADLPAGMSGASGIGALYAEAVKHARAAQLPMIATGHLHLHGGEMSELSERRIYIGGEAALSSGIFDRDISYVALGHLHKPQRVEGPTTIRYAGSPFPMSVVERSYEHSISVVDIDSGGAVRVDLVHIPRHVDFLRVPEEGASVPDAIEDMLRALTLDDPGVDRRPFLEIAVQLFSPEPDLRRRIDTALASKPVRLTRIDTSRLGADRQLADTLRHTTDLLELKPCDVFALMHKEQYAVDPTDDTFALFDEIVAAVQAAKADGDV
jgi:DNA repair protein SbcD/Mre11